MASLRWELGTIGVATRADSVLIPASVRHRRPAREVTAAMTAIMKYRAQGDAVLARMGNQSVPAFVKPALKNFQQVHQGYLVAADAADSARAVRDGALQWVAEGDATLDSSLLMLADKAVGAGLGSRTKPLASFTRYRVSDLTGLAYKKEAEEVVAMAGRITKVSPSKDVAAAAAACVKNAKTVQSRLAALLKPQGAYDKALRARDALLPAWMKAYAALKTQAAAAWDDDPATFKSVFAPVEAIQSPKGKRAKKPSTPAAPVAPTGS